MNTTEGEPRPGRRYPRRRGHHRPRRARGPVALAGLGRLWRLQRQRRTLDGLHLHDTPGVGYTGTGSPGAGSGNSASGDGCRAPMGTGSTLRARMTRARRPRPAAMAGRRSRMPARAWRLAGSSGLAATQRERSGMDQSGDWATSRGADREGEQVIPLAEEQLNVGKREVGGGRVRVRSYVVERPVEEQVSCAANMWTCSVVRWTEHRRRRGRVPRADRGDGRALREPVVSKEPDPRGSVAAQGRRHRRTRRSRIRCAARRWRSRTSAQRRDDASSSPLLSSIRTVWGKARRPKPASFHAAGGGRALFRCRV